MSKLKSVRRHTWLSRIAIGRHSHNIGIGGRRIKTARNSSAKQNGIKSTSKTSEWHEADEQDVGIELSRRTRH